MSKEHTISIKMHGILDYLAGLLLVTSPLYLPYPDESTKVIAFGLGGAVIMYSLMTDYPDSILRLLPFPVHRTFDFFVGVGLLFSPFEFQVNGLRAALFVILGVLLIALAFMTRGQFSRSGEDEPFIPGSHLR